MRTKIYGPLAKLQCNSLSHGSKTKLHPQKILFLALKSTLEGYYVLAIVPDSPMPSTHKVQLEEF